MILPPLLHSCEVFTQAQGCCLWLIQLGLGDAYVSLDARQQLRQACKLDLRPNEARHHHSQLRPIKLLLAVFVQDVHLYGGTLIPCT